MTDEIVPVDNYEARAEILRANTFGWYSREDLTDAEIVGNLLMEIPLALEIVLEARSTIARLRDEISDLKSGKIEDYDSSR